MAITFNTSKLDGGLSVTGAYARITQLLLKQYDTGQPDSDGNLTDQPYFGISYTVVMHTSASVRNSAGEYPNWTNRIRSSEVDQFHMEVTVSQMDAADANCFTLAYADLKTKLAAGGSPIATSIADA